MNDPDGNQIMDATSCYLVIEPNERLIWTTVIDQLVEHISSGAAGK